MLIENYKGIEIFHDATKDEFYTKVCIHKSHSTKKDEFIKNGRLQRTRDEIDKFLNTAAKKPVVKSAWLKSEKTYSDALPTYKKVEVILYNTISGTWQVKKADGKVENLKKPSYGNDGRLYLCCKENDAIVKDIMKANADIDKIKKSVSCLGGKLIEMVASNHL